MGRRRPRAAVAMGALVLACAGGCQLDPGDVPALDGLRQPTGLAISPDGPVLFVTNGNWDRVQTDSTLVAIDLDALDAALARPGDPGETGRACRRVADDDPTLECDPSAFIDPRVTVRLGTGAGNIAVDRRAGQDGPLRLLIPTRSPASVTWIDVLPGDEGVVLDCGQDDGQRCDEAHEIRRARDGGNEGLPGEPARVVIDGQGARFAYVPHILGGALSLVALDGEGGPELVDVEGDFFRDAPFPDEEIAGGFSIASRPCDPDRPSQESRECERPVLYATHRYFPGLRQLGIAPGLDLLLPGREIRLETIDDEVTLGRPFMGDLAFEDPAVGDRLLVVQTTPPALVRLDTSLDEEDSLREALPIGSVPLCNEPNVLALHHPAVEAMPTGQVVALVACTGDGRLAVVDLGSFRVLASVPVGEGAFEVVVDAEHQRAFVSNPGDDTISIVELDPLSPRRFTEWARLGLGAGRRP